MMWVGKRGVRFGLPVVRKLRRLAALKLFTEVLNDVSPVRVPKTVIH
jgi:hypothetical protein